MNKPFRLYVGQFSENVKVQDLEEFFSKYGGILHVELKRGYGFIDYELLDSVSVAVRETNGMEFMGSRLRVERAKILDDGNDSRRCSEERIESRGRHGDREYHPRTRRYRIDEFNPRYNFPEHGWKRPYYNRGYPIDSRYSGYPYMLPVSQYHGFRPSYGYEPAGSYHPGYIHHRIFPYIGKGSNSESRSDRSPE